MNKDHTISAEVHSDDLIATADFDAAPWFEVASDQQITDLASCGWGGDYPADYVAEWMMGKDDKVDDVFAYNNLVGKFKTMGFECYVSEEDAVRWVEKNRKHLLSTIAEATE